MGFCIIVALFLLALRFYYSFDSIMEWKPFGTSNDTKNNKEQGKSVEFMDRLSLYCLPITQTHAHTSLNISPVKHSPVWTFRP